MLLLLHLKGIYLLDTRYTRPHIPTMQETGGNEEGGGGEEEEEDQAPLRFPELKT